MKTLFINDFFNHNYEALQDKCILIVGCWLIVLIAIIIDFIAGVRKAIRIGEATTSHGFKRTVTKLTQYYGLLVFALMFDLLTSFVLSVSYFSLLASFFLVFIEARSVYEKGEEKERRKFKKEFGELVDAIDKIKSISKDEILNKVIDKLKEKDDTNERTT